MGPVLTGGRMPETVRDDDDGIRLDRWLREQLPELPFPLVQRLIRTGQVRVDGRRARGHLRLAAGQVVRIPPVERQARGSPASLPTDEQIASLSERMLYRDDHFIAINKPAGLAVQGGPGISIHLDGMLDALRGSADERPRLVHRLDRDTTGVLLLARSRRAAQHCSRIFRHGLADKVYWALVDGVPKPRSGQIAGHLRKITAGGERRMVGGSTGRAAATGYRTRGASGGVAWLELRPETGRTHQLRVHCAMIGCPIQGDAKYGGDGARSGSPLQLHAREIAVPDLEGCTLRIEAPVPETMRSAFARAGFRIPNFSGGAP